MSHEQILLVGACVAAAAGIGYCAGRLHQIVLSESAIQHWYHAYCQLKRHLR